jgi:hypothetical protein
MNMFIIGDKVYWKDPEGISSGEYTITEIQEDFATISDTFRETQVLYSEISRIIKIKQY